MKRINPNSVLKAQYFTLYAFAFTLPLHQKISTLILVLLSVLSLLRLNRKIDFGIPSYIFPVALYILVGLSLLYSESFEFKYLENRASLITFPLIFLTLKLDNVIVVRILKYFVLGCLTAIVCCYLNAFNNSLEWSGGRLVFRPLVNEDFSFFYAVVRDGNYFFAKHFSIFHDTIYFSLYLNTAIAIILSHSVKKSGFNKWNILALFLLTLVVFQLSSKMGIIICFILFTLFLFIKLKDLKLKILIPLLIIILGSVFLVKNPRGKVMVETFIEKGLTIDPENRFGYGLRLMSWDAAISIIEGNLLFGVGVADAQKELNKTYKVKGYTTPLKQNLNVHNGFLQILLECGLLGLFALLAIFIGFLHALFSIPSKQLFNLFLLIILGLGFLFESMLNRFSGISFVMLFYCLLVNYSQNVRKTAC
ncbi:O-antigen ligase family protein [Flagellimonas marinaquae]|uniref:O-antigen ligase family protein n=1 Tax=Flagellimonas marinaquae TaxID=254955 RepID=UPI0020759052|nr:O-antigen ligase family protein [Allomuricauda aquimarina]USD26665.1 O-antigen ligase family protein [Allomuricauda aquimarina]